MARFISIIVAAFLIFLGGEMVGYKAGCSHYEEMVQTHQLSQEDFYQQKMLVENTIVLIYFPPQLEKVRYARVGDVILTSGEDTLYFTHRCVINGYLSYTMENNHGTVWDLYQDGEMFFLSKRQEE